VFTAFVFVVAAIVCERRRVLGVALFLRFVFMLMLV